MLIQTGEDVTSELLSLLEEDCGPGEKYGRWYKFHCPFPEHAEGDRNPSLSVTPDNGFWYCFSCQNKGDTIDWLRKYRGYSYREAKEFLANYSETEHDQGYRPQLVKKSPPKKIWQQKALDLITIAQDNLWSKNGGRALDYLHSRGLTDHITQKYRLGYINCPISEPADSWGILDNHQNMIVPVGIVIPTIINQCVWGINIRRLAGEQKYQKIAGSKASLFGAENLLHSEIGLICEGEFDCMIADQEAGQFIGVATLGSATQSLDALTWGVYLMGLKKILVAYDNDLAGNKGSENLLRLGAKFKRINLPEGVWKDINDYHAHGENVREWLEQAIHNL